MDRGFLVRVIDEAGRWRHGRRVLAPGRAAVIVRVLIADDDPLIRDVLRDVLDEEPDLEVVAVAADVAGCSQHRTGRSVRLLAER